jgi:hypothetical protein
VYSDITDANGQYRINIPVSGFNRVYNLNVRKEEYTGAAGIPFYVSTIDERTYGPFDILLVKEQIPASKVDTLSAPSIPADRGVSSVVITATIRDQDKNIIDGGVVNSTVTAYVNFQLRNNSLDVTTGTNGSLRNTSGGTLVGFLNVIRVPIDPNGNASVTLRSGNLAGTVDIFNAVTVEDKFGKEVNATITVTFTPLQGHVAGTVRSSESARIENATVTAYRLVWLYNRTDAARGLDPWKKNWETIKHTTTDSVGDYVLPFLNLKFDVIGNTDLIWSYYEYNEETTSDRNGDVPPPLVNPPTSGSQLLTNIIKVTAEKSPYNNGYASDFVSVDETETMDIVLTSGQADELLVQIDGTPHQLMSDAAQNTTHTVTGKLLKRGNPFAVINEDVRLSIPNTNLVKFVVNGVAVNDKSIIVKTDADGIATATVKTSTGNTGVVRITGDHTTRDNVGLTDWDELNVVSSGEVSGTVSNENNVNLIGASVRITQRNATTGEYDIYPVKDIFGNDLTDKITNSIGFYTFTYVPGASYKVEATYNGVVGFAAPVIVTTGTKTANVVVVGALGSLKGTVTSNGTAIAGVDIFIGTNTVKSATTDVNGSYIIPDLAPGTISVKAVKSGYNDSTLSATIVSGETPTTLNFVLTSSGISLVDSYLPPAGTVEQRKAGLTRAMDDYFDNGVLSKAELINIMDAYFS